MNKKNAIWTLHKIVESPFAECLHGSPREVLTKPCANCFEGATFKISYPIVIEWIPGSDILGDFTWPGEGRAVVKFSVYNAVQSRFPMVRFDSVQMMQDPKLRIPKNKRRAKPRIWLPYEGPELIELIPTYRAPVHPSTTWEFSSLCETCGKSSKMLAGAESKMQRWDQKRQVLVPNWKAREPGKGLFISRSAIAGYPIFWAEEFSTPIFCTDEFKHFIEDRGFTNIDFLEWGEIVDD